MKDKSIARTIHTEHHRTQYLSEECFVGADGIALEIQYFHNKVPKLTIERQRKQYYTTKTHNRYHYFDQKSTALRAFYEWIRKSKDYSEDIVDYGVQEHDDGIYVYQFSYDAKALGFEDTGYREYLDPLKAQKFLRKAYHRVQQYEMYFASLLGFRYLRKALEDRTIRALLQKCDTDELEALCTTVIKEEHETLREVYQQTKGFIESMSMNRSRLTPLSAIFEFNGEKSKRVERLDKIEQEFLPRVFKNLLKVLSSHDDMPISWAIYTGEEPVTHIVEELIYRIVVVYEEAQQFATTIDSE